MTNNQQEIEKQIKQIVYRHNNKYDNIAIGFLIVEIIIKTNSKENRSPDLRYKTAMDSLFGKIEETPVGEKDEELLINAGRQFCFLGFDKEDKYKAYEGKSTPEAYACREASKSHVHTKYYDIVDGYQSFTKEHKSEIDKIAQRITPKFIKKKEHYVQLSIEKEMRHHAYASITEDGKIIEKPYGDNKFPEHDIQAYLKNNQNLLDSELALIDITRTKILNSPDFNYLWAKS